MTEIAMTYLQILISLFLWLFFVVGHEVIENAITDISESLRVLPRRLENILLSSAENLFAQYDVTQVEIFRRLNKDSDWDTLAKAISADDIEKYDIPIIRNKIKIEKIIGAAVGFLGMIAMNYAAATQAALTYSMLFPSNTIPPFLITPPITQLAITIIGISILNGLPLIDILGASNFTNASQININGKRTATRNTILIIRISNLLLTIFILSLTLLANENVSLYASSFLIIPVLTTLTLSFEFITGFFLVLSFTSFLLGILFGITEKVFEVLLRILKDFIHLQWLFFDKIIATPARSVISLINKR